MNIKSIRKYFISASATVDKDIYNSFSDFIVQVKKILVDESPVDSGDYKNAWESSGIEISVDGYSASVSNKSVQSTAIEFGSAPGKSPWPSPGSKTVSSGGRIFSTQAVGGTINKALLNDNIESFVDEIAESIIMAFK